MFSKLLSFIFSINVLDVVTVAVLGYAMFRGYKKGFINILFDIFALFGSMVIANHLYLSLNKLITNSIIVKVSWSWLLAYIFIYFISFLTFKFAGKGVSYLLGLTPFGTFNNVIGLMLNFGKWISIMTVILLFIIGITNTKINNYCKNTLLYKTYAKVSANKTVGQFIRKELAVILP